MPCASSDALIFLCTASSAQESASDRKTQAAQYGQRKQVGVLFLDLDGLEAVNVALGRARGDRLLQQVAMRLTACIRASDTARRLGGDEFVILLPDLESKENAVAAAAKIRIQLATPYNLDGAAVKITTSIGIAMYPFDGEQYAELLRAADRALCLDKARGRAPPELPRARTQDATFRIAKLWSSQ